ncbi:transcription factor IIIB 60 kDa subunit-like [Impatiens glandulifera]|uniref:transcription factor IIIB 60 kDa subunit-like n=1 Tax=Impatiens glandulifera TaxID=253017 RepID=UPI001FB04C2C|nr:transcription factor IIIB 60 kDa subunit-like [Impatiens glandulifera]
MALVWCSNCSRSVPTHLSDSFVCCVECGKVVEQEDFSTEATFVKNSSGQSQVAGTNVRSVQGYYSNSRVRTLDEAREHMRFLTTNLRMDDDDMIIGPAIVFYTIALERNFTKGRRKDVVCAACLYIACREKKKPYLLIDFSDELRTNVYVLGAVFLQLCKLLSLEEHPIVQKPLDPSLFIHRYCERLLGGRNFEVSRTALRIVASMKRDWIQTGRKPSGLCGAALYISALSYGLKCSKSEVVRVVHICESTLTKRLIEFENTESGGLTIEEFNTKAKELEALTDLRKEPKEESSMNELLCEHKKDGLPHHAHGLCKNCYDDFQKLSGGLDGGTNPPAFQRARERERLQMESDKIDDESSECFGHDESTGHETGPSQKYDGITEDCEDPETLSDIDDAEVDGYLHNEEETHFKKIIWEEMNKEYLQEQADKEAIAAAEQRIRDANLSNCPEEVQATCRLVAELKAKKEKTRRQTTDAKRPTAPPQSAVEATKQMLTKKRLSSKINYDALDKLFDEPVYDDKPKRSRNDTGYENNESKEDAFEEKDIEEEGGIAYENDEQGFEGNVDFYDDDD